MFFGVGGGVHILHSSSDESDDDESELELLESLSEPEHSD